MARSGSADLSARRRQLTDTARERHDALTAAIERLERALAAAASGRARPWSERVAAELELVGEEIRAHVESIEEQSGLFEEIRRDEPRLASRIEALEREHRRLIGSARSLAERVPGGDETDFAAVRREAAQLLAALRGHRAAEADLIYEAFWTDVGAVD